MMRPLNRLALILTAILFSTLGSGLRADKPAFEKIFDGKTLDGWMLVGGVGPGYVVKDGILVCPKDGGGNLVTVKEYSDFVFRFDFRFEPGGNNGVGVRTPLEGNLSY